jgi:hypothetical protein
LDEKRKRGKEKKGKGLLSPRRGTRNPQPESAVPVIGDAVVAVSGTAPERIVVPAAAASDTKGIFVIGQPSGSIIGCAFVVFMTEVFWSKSAIIFMETVLQRFQ